ncbi:Albumin superfamily member 1 [Apodemus speciosus]|uniref:Albumin superfamily member 1 n=1 Tax=Apodemus speciosus TaxID=105296 RepID=A0ABQ0ESA6_APOSI
MPCGTRFLYEYSRRQPELAVPVILRVFETYKHVLGKCCKLENPLECLQPGKNSKPSQDSFYRGLRLRHHAEAWVDRSCRTALPQHPVDSLSSLVKQAVLQLLQCILWKEVFQKVVLESRDRVKTYCDLHKQLGGSHFQDRLTVLYTKKAPQLSAQELVMFAKKMAAAASICCPLRDELQTACVEDQAKLILGALCRRHGRTPVNAGVDRCCDDSYAFRKPCFDDLQVDSTFTSPPLSCDRAISLKEDLCGAQDEELRIEKQKLLSNLAKQRPHAAEEVFHSLGDDFVHVVEKCCHAQRREVCFQEERLLTQWVCVKSGDSMFLASSQVLLLLVAWSGLG